MKNTKLWVVQLIKNPDSSGFGDYCLRVGLIAVADAIHTMKFRNITANAAVRKYIRNNLSAKLYLLNDGGNQLGDLFHYNGRGKPHQERSFASNLAKPIGTKDRKALMASGSGPSGYKVIFS